MTDHDALLAAVLAEPENDLPRLVFADWLEETGHPANAARAQYIRLQIEAERHAEKSARRFECTRQAEELRSQFRDEWDQAFPPGDLRHTRVGRHRGFVEEVETALDQLRTSGGVMFAVAPIQSLQLYGPPHPLVPSREWACLREMPFLTRLTRVKLGPGVWDAEQAVSSGTDESERATFLDCPFLTRLRRLDLPGTGLEDGDIVALVAVLPETACRASLRELDLSGNAITDAGANTLAAGRDLDALESLRLAGNRIGPDGRALLRRRFGARVVL